MAEIAQTLLRGKHWLPYLKNPLWSGCFSFISQPRSSTHWLCSLSGWPNVVERRPRIDLHLHPAAEQLERKERASFSTFAVNSKGCGSWAHHWIMREYAIKSSDAHTVAAVAGGHWLATSLFETRWEIFHTHSTKSAAPRCALNKFFSWDSDAAAFLIRRTTCSWFSIAWDYQILLDTVLNAVVSKLPFKLLVSPPLLGLHDGKDYAYFAHHFIIDAL